MSSPSTSPGSAPRNCQPTFLSADWSFRLRGGARGSAVRTSGCRVDMKKQRRLGRRQRRESRLAAGLSAESATRPRAADGTVGRGGGAAAPLARHGDGKGVRADRQGWELGGHLPGAGASPERGRPFAQAQRTFPSDPQVPLSVWVPPSAWALLREDSIRRRQRPAASLFVPRVGLRLSPASQSPMIPHLPHILQPG